MVRSQASAVSKEVGRKRKRLEGGTQGPNTGPAISSTTPEVIKEIRTESPSSTSKIPTRSKDGGSNPKRKKKSAHSAEGASESEASSTGHVPAKIPWPDEFKRLEKIHRTLNSTYTFFCTRKHLATTLDNMQSLLRSNLGFEASINDVSKM